MEPRDLNCLANERRILPRRCDVQPAEHNGQRVRNFV